MKILILSHTRCGSTTLCKWISNEWINDNRNKIIETVYKYEHLKNDLKNKNLFQITYENMYINKTDVNKVISYLNIQNPRHLDMLDYNKKYRKDTYTLTYDTKRKSII